METQCSQIDSRNIKLRLRLLDSNKDLEKVIALFADTFSRFEPLSKHLGQDRATFLPFAKSAAKRCTKESLSFVCEDISDGDRLVGFILNETFDASETNTHSSNENEIDHCESDDENDCDDNNQIKSLLKQLDRQWQLQNQELVETERIFHIAAVGVDSDYNNLGIASKLILASLNHAKATGYRVVIVEATAIATQKIFEKKYGFKAVVKQIYDEFTYNGKNVFKGLNDPPYCILFEKYLDDWNCVQIEECCNQAI
ncbi:hypothetical protein B4U79_16749 [Dinothrombium tinctorium]|uniref:N-acetyltransferase domain-containing protein n=1 Tax=Dinothrombium tinctorium TaxID=1965070 RepID=A0A443QE63_9ACAR|nr:hypothetical protein B4U79_16749 [Dinothrombium tinctorium]